MASQGADQGVMAEAFSADTEPDHEIEHQCDHAVAAPVPPSELIAGSIPPPSPSPERESLRLSLESGPVSSAESPETMEGKLRN